MTSEALERINAMKDGDYIIRLPEVMHKTGLSRSSIYKMIEDKQFPRQIRLGARSVGWVNSEVDDWLLQRIQQRAS